MATALHRQEDQWPCFCCRYRPYKAAHEELLYVAADCLELLHRCSYPARFPLLSYQWSLGSATVIQKRRIEQSCLIWQRGRFHSAFFFCLFMIGIVNLKMNRGQFSDHHSEMLHIEMYVSIRGVMISTHTLCTVSFISCCDMTPVMWCVSESVGWV